MSFYIIQAVLRTSFVGFSQDTRNISSICLFVTQATTEFTAGWGVKDNFGGLHKTASISSGLKSKICHLLWLIFICKLLIETSPTEFLFLFQPPVFRQNWQCLQACFRLLIAEKGLLKKECKRRHFIYDTNSLC